MKIITDYLYFNLGSNNIDLLNIIETWNGELYFHVLQTNN